MCRLILFTIFFTIIAVLQLANAASLNPYQYELHQGSCSGDRLVNEDIIKTGAPYTTKKLTYTWRGNNMYYITCLNVYNKMGSLEGGSVKIVNGGLGQSEVIVEMLSKNGKGMNFHLELYGKLLARN